MVAMLHRFGLAAALALPLWTAPQAASAEVFFRFCFGLMVCRDDSDEPSERTSTMFDLGIEVNNVPPTKAGVSRFMASLEPQTQYILVRTCQNYLSRRGQARSPYTINFCQVLLA
jgi:hypothetical protein